MLCIAVKGILLVASLKIGGVAVVVSSGTLSARVLSWRLRCRPGGTTVMIPMRVGRRTRLRCEDQLVDRRTRVAEFWLSLMEAMPRLSRFRRHPLLRVGPRAWLKFLLSWSRTSRSQTSGIHIPGGWPGRGFMSRLERNSTSRRRTVMTL